MCARYGWTLHYIYSLPYMWFFDQLDVLNENLQREYKDEMILQAFNAWQVIEAVKAMLGGDKSNGVNFGKYLQRMNLMEKEDDDNPLDKVSVQLEKKQALETANDILANFKKERGNIK